MWYTFYMFWPFLAIFREGIQQRKIQQWLVTYNFQLYPCVHIKILITV